MAKSVADQFAKVACRSGRHVRDSFDAIEQTPEVRQFAPPDQGSRK